MTKTRMKQKHQKTLHPVKSQWEMQRGKATYETGIVVSISHQGNGVYAVVRKKGNILIDVDGNKVRVGTGLFGNIYNVPEKDLAMTEVLLPTDLDATRLVMNYKYLIGATVKVQVDNGYPRMVHFSNNNAFEARIVGREDLYRARTNSDNLSLKDQDALDFFRAIGIDEVIAKALTDEKIKEGQLCYGNYSTPDMVSQSDKSSKVVVDTNPALVTGLPSTTLKEKDCHIFPSILGGIW